MTIMSTGVDAVLPTDIDRDKIQRLDAALHRATAIKGARLITATGETYDIPDELSDLVVQLVHELATGNSVTVAPAARALTTQEAAQMLGVSRPHLIKLLEAGELTFHRVGTHRRVEVSDVAEYKERRREHRKAARRRLTDLSVEAGLAT